MAERSTAAVDVAANDGEEPVSTEAEQQTTSDAEQSTGQVSAAEPDAAATPREAAEDDDPPEETPEPGTEQPSEPASESSAPDLEPPQPHSGHKLARRYRLEECVTRLDGFSSWRAMDEKLRRAVGIHLLPANHPRARRVLAAARSAALLGDPRFVQVLDAVEEGDFVYVVHEWLPDATELGTILAGGPLDPHDAYQLVSQISQAMSAAHREGLAHLRLTPGSVLRTHSGQYRIRGLAVMAALRGITADHPQRTDTEAIGALLYAALTQRWPYEGDAYGLSGLPKDVGLIPPDQVRAGVHRGLSELSMRALVNNGSTPFRQEQPCTTPEELAKAVAAIPPIRPPEPSFATPTYPSAAYRQPSFAQTAAPGLDQGAPARPVATPPRPLQSRSGKALTWAVSALLIAALGLGSWQVADALINRFGPPEGSSTAQEKGSGGEGETPKSTPIPVEDISEFSPLGPPVAEDTVGNAVDGDRATAWITPHYKGYANFGNLPARKQGSGVILDLGSVKSVTGVSVRMYRAGQTVELRAAETGAQGPTALSDFPRSLGAPETAGDELKISLDKPLRTRYLLVHITKLPPDGSASQFRGGISEIKLTG
ncbi:protein kinase family protein [Streptomyces sp. TP-A0874]|uniref:protein kinase family protein n=1 Tax=Streptomyces sp. TP-A0874 TaxID=549819 RepID=UPI000853E04E|nr:protein kinase family protein [Streptomyces sp. TP-A0874]